MPDKLRRGEESGPAVNLAVLRIPLMPVLTNCGPNCRPSEIPRSMIPSSIGRSMISRESRCSTASFDLMYNLFHHWFCHSDPSRHGPLTRQPLIHPAPFAIVHPRYLLHL